jgi:predicted pyridoxine 5'-phosphate oxidase superfamily flavin-nucleotide-binding protein
MAYAEIAGAGELRDLLGVPSGRAVTKERTRLHAVDREWLAISPFCIVATSDATLTKRVMKTPETLEELEEHYAVANYSRLLY